MNISIEVEGVFEGVVRYQLTCLECGGWEQNLRGDMSNMAMVHCSSCGKWLGRLAALNLKAALAARSAGHEIDLSRYLPPRLSRPSG